MTSNGGHLLRQEIGTLVEGVRHEIASVATTVPQGRHATSATIAVLLATTCAQFLHLENPAWAAISGFMITQASAPAAWRRGLLRLAGTMTGAALGVLLASWLLYDIVACTLVMMLAAFIGILGQLTSRYGYAWLLSSITLFMVLLGAVSNPPAALTTAIYRTLEVLVGTGIAMLTTWALMPPADAAAPAPLPAPEPHVIAHAIRSAIAVGLVPLVWIWLDLPGLSQMAVTVAAVMAVPALTGHQADDRAIVVRRSLQRVIGCLIGGLAALGILALSLQSYLPWLAALGVGVWVGTFVHAGRSKVTYVGTQGVVAFIITLVQGLGPPDSLAPAVQRMAGILVGLLVLLAVNIVLTPDQASPDVDSESSPGTTTRAG